MTMNCDEIRNKISGYVDGELPEEEVTILDEHLETCPECQLQLESERETRTIFVQAYTHAKAPVKLRSKIRKSLARDDKAFGILSLIIGQPKAIAAVAFGVILVCAVSIQAYRMLHTSSSVMNVMHIQDMHAKIECIGCHYAEESLATKSYCEEYGHTPAIMTDNHDIFSLIPNDKSKEFAEFALHSSIMITGWMYYQANFIEIEDYQLISVASLHVPKN